MVKNSGNGLELKFFSHCLYMGKMLYFVNMRVRRMVTIGSLYESDPCESDCDLENENVQVRTSVTNWEPI